MKCSGHSNEEHIIIIISVIRYSSRDNMQKCIGCICEAASGCNITVGCNGPVCGPFYITKQYWDCTGNGVIDCDDYVRIHQFGASGCTNTL
ncbi:hypothetical protein ALC60_14839 [Trachymyrmex zeteki]|uniref:lysozyme n=1 Tax=Mycetomoellerius zeteki TaxID=64791 RepID=A0A151WEB9_9HYME|nr:hypothetical protein ALC60_14839 [Trachymyrmex zeteki]